MAKPCWDNSAANAGHEALSILGKLLSLMGVKSSFAVKQLEGSLLQACAADDCLWDTDLHHDPPDEAPQDVAAAEVGRRDAIGDHVDHSSGMVPHHLHKVRVCRL